MLGQACVDLGIMPDASYLQSNKNEVLMLESMKCARKSRLKCLFPDLSFVNFYHLLGDASEILI